MQTELKVEVKEGTELLQKPTGTINAAQRKKLTATYRKLLVQLYNIQGHEGLKEDAETCIDFLRSNMTTSRLHFCTETIQQLSTVVADCTILLDSRVQARQMSSPSETIQFGDYLQLFLRSLSRPTSGSES